MRENTAKSIAEGIPERRGLHGSGSKASLGGRSSNFELHMTNVPILAPAPSHRNDEHFPLSRKLSANMMDGLPRQNGPPSQRETNAASAMLERMNTTIAEQHLDALRKRGFPVASASLEATQHLLSRIDSNSVIKYFQEIVAYLCEKLRETEEQLQTRVKSECSEYEGSLQKLEKEIRDHVRTEQQQRLFVETLEERIEENEKSYQALNAKLTESQKQIVSLKGEMITKDREKEVLASELEAKKKALAKLEEAQLQESAHFNNDHAAFALEQVSVSSTGSERVPYSTPGDRHGAAYQVKASPAPWNVAKTSASPLLMRSHQNEVPDFSKKKEAIASFQERVGQIIADVTKKATTSTCSNDTAEEYQIMSARIREETCIAPQMSSRGDGHRVHNSQMLKSGVRRDENLRDSGIGCSRPALPLHLKASLVTVLQPQQQPSTCQTHR